MSSFDPSALLDNASPYQEAIFTHVYNQVSNKLKRQPVNSLVVSSCAGSGKTSSMIAATKAVELAVNPSMKVVGKTFTGIALAFNSAIAADFKDRLPDWMEAKTLNSLGWGICYRYANASQGRKVPFNDFNDKNKVSRIMREVMTHTERKDYRDDVKFLVGMAKSLGIVPEGAKDCVPVGNLKDDLSTWKGIARKFNKSINAQVMPTVVGFVRKVLLADIQEYVEKGICDFDDQKWLAVIYKPYGEAMSSTKYDYISVDECQDLNQVDIALIQRILKPSGYVIFFGDKNQCQPAGTMVSVPRTKDFISGDGSTTVPIETLKVGDPIVSYYSKKSCFSNVYGKGETKVEEIASRQYVGNMYTITCGDKVSRSTNNHKWLARLNESARDKYIVYLMERGGKFRVGTCKLLYKSGAGLTHRALQEKADRAWMLSVHDTKIDAMLHEQLVGFKFGIPDRTFVSSMQSPSMGMDGSTYACYIAKFWELFPENRQGAIDCLEDIGKSIDFPIWDNTYNNRHMGRYSFIIEACNLFSEIMIMRTFGGALKSGEWEPITVSHAATDEMVFSLKVGTASESDRRLYISDGIVTHNSVYSFRGADIDSISKIINAFDADELPLSISYRCGKNIVEAARNVYDHIEAAPNAIDGEVVKYKEYEASMFKGADLILCRTNAPTISFAYKLILKGIPTTVRGRDIGVGLLGLIKNFNATSVKSLNIKLESWYQTQVNINMQENGGELDAEAIQPVQDKFDCVRVFVKNAKNDSVDDLLDDIQNLFGSEEESKEMVILSTIHKAKGLEAERVFFLDTHIMYPDYIQKGSWQETQEKNLEYVALTRAKAHLGFIYSNNMV